MMERRRLLFHEVLCEVLGSRNVYFQPPESVKMKYPAIVYSRDGIDSKHANNGVYLSQMRYSVTVIDKDPDSPIVGKVALLPTSKFNRHYEKDNLNHDVYTIFY